MGIAQKLTRIPPNPNVSEKKDKKAQRLHAGAIGTKRRKALLDAIGTSVYECHHLIFLSFFFNLSEKMTTRNSINRQISLETIYRLIDTNNDGFLTKKELTSALMLNQAVQQELEQLPGMSTRLHPNKLRQAIQDMDMDGDDKVTLIEFCRYVDQVANDEQYEKFRSSMQEKTIKSEEEQDALPDIAQMSAVRRWIRTSGRSNRIATDHERKQIQRRVMEKFCQVGFQCTLDQLDMARLHQEQTRLRKLIANADVARAAPDILAHFAALEQKKRNELLQILRTWRQYAMEIISGASAEPSLSYWRKYQERRKMDEDLESRARAVLTDDDAVVVATSSCADRRLAMSRSMAQMPSLLGLGRNSEMMEQRRSKTALQPLGLRRKRMTVRGGMTASASMPTLQIGAPLPSGRTWRKRTWLPNQVILSTIVPSKENLPFKTSTMELMVDQAGK